MTIAAQQDTSIPVGDEVSPRAKLSAHISGVFHTIKQLASLQVSIWVKHVKSLITQIVLFAILSLVAFVFVILGVIFLYAGVFHVLTDIAHIPTVWALLIFAAVHLLAAGGLVVTAISMLNKRHKKEKAEDHS